MGLHLIILSVVFFVGLIADFLVQLCQRWRLMISVWKMNHFYVSFNICVQNL